MRSRQCQYVCTDYTIIIITSSPLQVKLFHCRVYECVVDLVPSWVLKEAPCEVAVHSIVTEDLMWHAILCCKFREKSTCLSHVDKKAAMVSWCSTRASQWDLEEEVWHQTRNDTEEETHGTLTIIDINVKYKYLYLRCTYTPSHILQWDIWKVWAIEVFPCSFQYLVFCIKPYYNNHIILLSYLRAC